jgi:hypothetical protein
MEHSTRALSWYRYGRNGVACGQYLEQEVLILCSSKVRVLLALVLAFEHCAMVQALPMKMLVGHLQSTTLCDQHWLHAGVK